MGSQPKSFYDILGVTRSASQSEIRGAFLRLMKQHHPDSSGRGSAEPHLASVLNRCYATLKDPEARSQYDERLDRSLEGKLLPLRRSPSRRAHQQHRNRGAGPAFATLLFAGVVALSLWASGPQPAPSFSSAAGWPQVSVAATKPDVHEAPSEAQRAKQIADLARGFSTAGAERFSQSCFAQARRSANQAALDSCVLFDLAYLLWKPLPDDTRSPSYFSPQLAHYRHHDALSNYDDRLNSRLTRLREQAISGLIKGVQEAKPEAVANQPPSPDILSDSTAPPSGD